MTGKEQPEGGEEERTDWVAPIGTGKVDYRHFTTEDLENMAEQGINIAVNADQPKQSVVTQTVVEGMPAPKKK